MNSNLGQEDTLPISAVICTLNSISSISKCLLSLKLAGVRQIIVVDGGSTDGTREIISSFDCEIYFDPGTGLGEARNRGIAHANQPFILNCGPDNSLDRKLLNSMLTTLCGDQTIAAVGCKTRVEATSWLAKMLNIQWNGRITPGIEDVLGTPNLFHSELLKNFQYSSTRTFSDDEELSHRVRDLTGLRFHVVADYCEEIGQDSLAQLRRRFKYYGKSDFEIYGANRDTWTLKRKLKSILHPLNAELLDIRRNITLREFCIAFPFLLWATGLRYLGWLQSKRNSKAGNERQKDTL